MLKTDHRSQHPRGNSKANPPSGGQQGLGHTVSIGQRHQRDDERGDQHHTQPIAPRSPKQNATNGENGDTDSGGHRRCLPPRRSQGFGSPQIAVDDRTTLKGKIAQVGCVFLVIEPTFQPTVWCRKNREVFGNSNQLVFLWNKHGGPQLLRHHLPLVGLHAPDLWQLDRLTTAKPVVEERLLWQVVANRKEEFLVGRRARHVERVGRPTLRGLLVFTSLFDRHPSLVNEDLRDIRITGQVHPQPLPLTTLEPVPGTDAGGAVLVDHHLDQRS